MRFCSRFSNYICMGNIAIADPTRTVPFKTKKRNFRIWLINITKPPIFLFTLFTYLTETEEDVK